MFDTNVITAIKDDAMRRFPNEACGLVVEGLGYVPIKNVASDPENEFVMGAEASEYFMHHTVLAVVHSHPNDYPYPSMRDQIDQNTHGLLCGISSTDGHTAADPVWWGPGIPDVPYVGRVFRWGPTASDGSGDCYALLCDWYRREKGIILPFYARDEDFMIEHPNLYERWPESGFREVSQSDMRPGDTILFSIRNKCRPNHAAVYLGEGMMLHHLENRLSEITDAGRWMNVATHVLRPPA